MKTDRYQKGMDTIMEYVEPDEDNPTGHMDIGRGFKDIAPDLEDFIMTISFCLATGVVMR